MPEDSPAILDRRLRGEALGDWAVTDDEGHYDTSENGDLRYLHWIQENKVRQLSEFKAAHYRPKLLINLLSQRDGGK